MLKVIVLLSFFAVTQASAVTLHIVAENNGSNIFKFSEAGKVFNNFKKNVLKEISIDKVNIIGENRSKVFNVNKKKPRIKKLKSYEVGLIESLENVIAGSYLPNDIIVFISSMDYKDRSTNTDSTGKTYNDAWITSTKSPLKRLLDTYPNTPLNETKVIVLDPSHNLSYLKSRERFFSYMFARLGGKLIYYGSLDGDKDRFKEYVLSKKDLHKLMQTPSLRDEIPLKLDDKVIQYELP